MNRSRRSVNEVGEYTLDIPVFRPTKEEFANFEGYIEKIESDERAAAAGLVKVIPPSDWNTKPNPYTLKKNQDLFIKPIKQFISGKKGAYRLDLVESKKRTIVNFQAEAAKQTTPCLLSSPQDEDCAVIFEGVATDLTDKGLVWKGNWYHAANRQTTYPFEYSLRVERRMNDSVKYFRATGSFLYSSIEGQEEIVEDNFELVSIPVISGEEGKFHIEGFGTNILGTHRLSGALDGTVLWIARQYVEQTSSAFEIPAAIHSVRNREFSVFENSFWGSMQTNSAPPLYGGDQCGTMFDSNNEWNLNELDSILRVGFHDQQAKGITLSMLYVGMWRAMFAWHTEDMELNSINYIHYGCPKIWYSIPPNYAQRFETVAKMEFGDEANRCSEFIRHKNLMISPSILQKAKIPHVRAIQYQGEFIITFPRSYHGGFNTGFNIAEAVNFATKRWIPIGRRSRWCKCEDWTFRIDMDLFTETIRDVAPERLDTLVGEGDRILYTWKEQKYLCRVRKNTKKGKNTGVLVVPIDKTDCPFVEQNFDPETDEWDWPASPFRNTLKRIPNNSRKRQVDLDPENIDKRRKTWNSLSNTRRDRRLLRRLQIFEHNAITILPQIMDPMFLHSIVSLDIPEDERRNLLTLAITGLSPQSLVDFLMRMSCNKKLRDKQAIAPPRISLKKERIQLLDHLENSRPARIARRKQAVIANILDTIIQSLV